MNLLETRLLLGLSLRKAALAVGCSHETIRNAESGSINVGYQTIDRIRSLYEKLLKEKNNE